MGGTRLEQTALALSKTPIATPSGTESGTLNGQSTPLDRDLAFLWDRWPKLPEHIRAAVLALVRSHGQN
jgi:hypothetical protein